MGDGSVLFNGIIGVIILIVILMRFVAAKKFREEMHWWFRKVEKSESYRNNGDEKYIYSEDEIIKVLEYLQPQEKKFKKELRCMTPEEFFEGSPFNIYFLEDVEKQNFYNIMELYGKGCANVALSKAQPQPMKKLKVIEQDDTTLW
jgi:hypothetical protein